MKIAVIAASGRSGKIFVEAALQAGHSIQAGVRNKHAFAEHPKLEIIRCDATNLDDLRKLLAGQDAVASFIGHSSGSPANLQTKATEQLIRVMNELSLRRIVSLTGTGVRMPDDKITLLDKILNVSISLIDPARIKDGIEHVKLLERSQLDWTALRVLKLQNTRQSGYTLRLHGPAKLISSRMDVAAATVEVLEKNSFLQQAPMVA